MKHPAQRPRDRLPAHPRAGIGAISLERAGEIGIEGCASMDKAELIGALRDR